MRGRNGSHSLVTFAATVWCTPLKQKTRIYSPRRETWLALEYQCTTTIPVCTVVVRLVRVAVVVFHIWCSTPIASTPLRRLVLSWPLNSTLKWLTPLIYDRRCQESVALNMSLALGSWGAEDFRTDMARNPSDISEQMLMNKWLRPDAVERVSYLFMLQDCAVICKWSTKRPLFCDQEWKSSVMSQYIRQHGSGFGGGGGGSGGTSGSSPHQPFIISSSQVSPCSCTAWVFYGSPTDLMLNFAVVYCDDFCPLGRLHIRAALVRRS